jgi:small GTP-binding protein
MTTMPPLVALVGNPNAGKSALFNALTGARQKIANYPGVTVERKSGRAALPDGRPVELLDLPGAYSLEPDSLDEAVTRDVVLGRFQGHRRPDALIIVVDAGNLDNHLRFALELIGQGLPVVVALNMVDLASRDGLELDAARLSNELGVPVIETVAVRKRGLAAHITRPGIANGHCAKSDSGAVTRYPECARAQHRTGRHRQRNPRAAMDQTARFGPAASGRRRARAAHAALPDVPGGL